MKLKCYSLHLFCAITGVVVLPVNQKNIEINFINLLPGNKYPPALNSPELQPMECEI